MKRIDILFFLTCVMMLLITCNKPVCPVPKAIQFNVPEVKISSCTNTSVPVQLTSCAQTLMIAVNKILYARSNPNDGIAHRSCPDPTRWKPYEVNYIDLNYQLFTPIDKCGSGSNSAVLNYIFISDYNQYDYDFCLFNAKEDLGFSYYGYCLPEAKYRGEFEYDTGQNFSFYYLDANDEMIYLSKKDIISVRSITLDCDYINNYSAPYLSRAFFQNSSFGVAVELEMKTHDGAGTYVMDAYIKSSTGLSGDFGAWTTSVFWKVEL